MGDTLFGGEVSGTPLETRGGTEEIGGNLLAGGGRLQSGAGRGLGLTGGVENLGIEQTVQRLLANPADQLRGLFAALEPFEERQTEEAVSGVRSGFGRLGGRFSRNAEDAEIRTRAELASTQTRDREGRILEANQLQSQMLAQLFQALLGERGQTLGFFQPGAPNFREGVLGDLIRAGGNVAANAALPGAGAVTG